MPCSRFCIRRIRFGQRRLDLGLERRDRRPQLMRRIRNEVALGIERMPETAEQFVDFLDHRLDFIGHVGRHRPQVGLRTPGQFLAQAGQRLQTERTPNQTTARLTTINSISGNSMPSRISRTSALRLTRVSPARTVKV